MVIFSSLPYLSTQHNVTSQFNIKKNIAQKSKIFSRPESLSIRIGIATGIQILGYEVFWSKIFDEFDLVMDEYLCSFLGNFQKRKDVKKAMGATKGEKSRRSNHRVKKCKGAEKGPRSPIKCNDL